MTTQTQVQVRNADEGDARRDDYADVDVKLKGEGRVATSSDFFHLLLAFPQNKFTAKEFAAGTGLAVTTVHKWLLWAERRAMVERIGKTKILVSSAGAPLGKSIRYSTLYRRTVKVMYDP